MRNSIFPRHTIGSQRHDLFTLCPHQGLIQGITKVHDPETIKVERLADYAHLRNGEVQKFPVARKIEVIEFGAYIGRVGTVSTLASQIIELEADAVLTGPAAWREVDDAALPLSEKPSHGNSLATNVCIVAGFSVAFGVMALMSIAAFIMCAATMAFVWLWLLVLFGAEASRTSHIARTGSAYILAPRDRVWAGYSPGVV